MVRRVGRAPGRPDEARAAQDATAELRETIAALKAERQRFNEVLDVLPAYVVLLSPDYHVPFANRLFRERFGEAHGRRCFEYLFMRSEPCEACEAYRALQTNSPVEWEWIGPDGRNYDVFDYPFTDTDGSTLILEMGIDATERKRAEAEIRRLNAELEQRVLERTQELSEANERLQDVLRAVSHDLRNPLAAIQGQAQLLQRRLERGVPPQRLRENVDSILASARRMGAMIGDLVDSTRSECGQLQLDCQPVDLVSFVRRLVQEQAGAMDIARIEIEEPVSLPPVSGDPGRLQRILVNLFSNALKYSDASTPVTVRFQQRGGEVITSVTDHGRGIRPQDVPHLFQRYFRGGAGYARPEGLGLGLYITRQLVEGHGGRIWVESTPGVGSTFSFSLPAAHTGQEPTPEKSPGL